MITGEGNLDHDSDTEVYKDTEAKWRCLLDTTLEGSNQPRQHVWHTGRKGAGMGGVVGAHAYIPFSN